jgi:hypothetical protein
MRNRRCERHPAADRHLLRDGANGRRSDAKQVSPRDGDERIGPNPAHACIEAGTAGRRIDEHGRHSPAEERDHRDVERHRHPAEEDRAHPWFEAVVYEVRRCCGDGTFELRVGDGSSGLDDRQAIAGAASLLLENGRDVHAPSPRENSA